MSGLRRFLHTGGAQLNAATAAAASASSSSGATTVSPTIPFSVARYVAKHLERNAGSTSVQVPNPFLPQRKYRQQPSPQASASSLEESAASSSKYVVPPYISKRRQKQLFDYHDVDSLPPTTLGKQVEPHSTTYGSDASPGLTVSWTGERRSRVDKSLYGGRRSQFKLHRHEREKHLRVKDTSDRMAGMDKRIVDWRNSQAEAKALKKPNLPF